MTASVDQAQFPGMPLDDGEPVFASPWQARTFAMAVQCHEQGLFNWVEWAEELSRHIAEYEKDSSIDDSDDYYQLWQSTLEVLVARKAGSVSVI